MSYDAEVLADSPVHYLKFDETSGTAVTNYGSNGTAFTNTNAVLNAAPVMPSGVASYDFQANAEVSLAVSAADMPASFTVEAWIQPDATSFNAIIAKDAPNSGFAFYVASGVLNCYTNGAGHVGSTTVSTTGAHHVAATFDSATSTLKLYLDGALDSTFSATHSPAPDGGSLTPLMVGVSTGSNGGGSRYFRFDGRIDEVAFYASALSGTRIAAHYDAATAAPETTGTLSAVLPALGADLSGGIEFAGTIAASLPSLGANLAGTSLPPGVAGTLSATLPPLGGSLVGAYSDTATLAAVLPPLSADLAGAYTPPPVTGTLSAVLPGLSANLSGTAYEPGMNGTLNAVLPALTASLSGDVLGRAGLGLALDSSAVLTVEAALEPEPTVPPGTPSTALHIIAPTVPVPTLVAGRPQ